MIVGCISPKTTNAEMWIEHLSKPGATDKWFHFNKSFIPRVGSKIDVYKVYLNETFMELEVVGLGVTLDAPDVEWFKPNGRKVRKYGRWVEVKLVQLYSDPKQRFIDTKMISPKLPGSSQDTFKINTPYILSLLINKYDTFDELYLEYESIIGKDNNTDAATVDLYNRYKKKRP